jgi:hypothetical protein
MRGRVLLFLVAVSLPFARAAASPAPSVHRLSFRIQLERVRIQADWRRAEFRTGVIGQRVSETKRLPHSCQASACSARMGGRLVVIRRVKDLEKMLRRHLLHYQLAHEAGAGHLVLPAEGVLLGERAVMIVEHAGLGWTSGQDAPRDWHKRVTEADRLVSATLDVISAQDDRLWKNILLNATGGLKLIDQDKSLERTHKPSLFFARGGLAYASAQERFSDLPESLQLLVEYIGRSPISAIRTHYHLPESEAQELLYGARSIRLHGLSGAIRIRTQKERSLDLELESDRMPAPIVPLFQPSRWLEPALSIQ